VILATSNSYRATGDTLKGLRLDGRLILMGISDEPLTVTGHLLIVDVLLDQSKMIENISMKP